MDQIFEFSNKALYTTLLLAIGLFLLLRLLTWFLPLLLVKKNKRKQAWRFTSLFELTVWIIFLIWSVNFLAESSPVYAIGLFILLFIFTFYTIWLGLKDFIAGAFFKTNKTFSVNEEIKIGDYSGKIIKFNPSALLLETESGESIHLPYSFLIGKVMIKSHPAETILNHTFRIEIPKSENLLFTIQKIRIDLLNMPWSSLKKTPQIKLLMETQKGQMLEITVFSIETGYFPEMENIIKGKYSIAVTKSV